MKNSIYTNKLNNCVICKYCLLIFLLFTYAIISPVNGQNNRLLLQQQRDKEMEKIKQLSDTSHQINLMPIYVLGNKPFKNLQEENKFNQLKSDIERTYPLAQIVCSEVKLVNSEIDLIYTNSLKRKEYLKWYEKHTFSTYIDTLRSLNNRQIKLFVKLIQRETGYTPYHLIKKYRGGFDAFLWQMTASAFLINLKTEYDPDEDKMIEVILSQII